MMSPIEEECRNAWYNAPILEAEALRRRVAMDQVFEQFATMPSNTLHPRLRELMHEAATAEAWGLYQRLVRVAGQRLALEAIAYVNAQKELARR